LKFHRSGDDRLFSGEHGERRDKREGEKDLDVLSEETYKRVKRQNERRETTTK
jgi:hypothetical protein